MTLPALRLSISSQSKDRLRSKPKEWVTGDLSWSDTSCVGVGLRIKGSRTLQSIDDKPSLKIRLDAAVAPKAARSTASCDGRLKI
jgi:hypothetical protein